MVIKSKENSLGAKVFLLGVILSLIIGISSSLIPSSALNKFSSAIYAILVILGIIVGFINIKGKDVNTFMLAGAVLVIVSRFGMDPVRGSLIGFPIADTVATIFGALLTLFVPATIIVALKAVFEIAKI